MLEGLIGSENHAATEESPPQLSEREIIALEAAASTNYKGNYTDRVGEVLGIKTSSTFPVIGRIYRKLGVHAIFPAVAVALERGLLSLEGLVDSNLERVNAMLSVLTQQEKSVLVQHYADALPSKVDEVRTSSEVGFLSDVSYVIYRKATITGVQNLAQLAVLAHACFEEARQLNGIPKSDGKYLEALRIAARLDYSGNFTERIAEVLNLSNVSRRLSSDYRSLGANNAFAAVCVALDKGQFLLEELANGRTVEGLVAALNNPKYRSRDYVALLTALFEWAVENPASDFTGVAESLNLGRKTLASAINRVYDNLSMYPNVAQLAVLAYVCHAWSKQVNSVSA